MFYVLFTHLLVSSWNSYFIRLPCIVFFIKRVPDSIGCSLFFFFFLLAGREKGEKMIYTEYI